MTISGNKRSICFVSPFAYPLLTNNGTGAGGAERQFTLFAKGLKNDGWDVSFITHYPDYNLKRLQTIFPVYPCNFSYMGGPKYRILIDWLSLYVAMNKSDSYYYILKVPGHLLAPMSIFCHLKKRKLVFWSQTSHDACKKRTDQIKIVSLLQDWGIKRSSTVIAQTESQLNDFENNYNLKANLVPSIAGELRNKNSYNSIGHNLKKIDILWAGNSTKNKRFDVVISLAKMLPQYNFTVAMNKSDLDLYHSSCEQCASLNNVNFVGQVSHVEMEHLFEQAKIFLNTSIREGFPNTYLQAWMNGVPVVSLNIDPDNIIEKYGLGRIVKEDIYDINNKRVSGNVLRLRDYVFELLINHDLREYIGQRAVEYIQKCHTVEKVLPELIRVLQNSK